MKRKHIGSNFDDFLKAEGILSEGTLTGFRCRRTIRMNRPQRKIVIH